MPPFRMCRPAMLPRLVLLILRGTFSAAARAAVTSYLGARCGRRRVLSVHVVYIGTDFRESPYTVRVLCVDTMLLLVGVLLSGRVSGVSFTLRSRPRAGQEERRRVEGYNFHASSLTGQAFNANHVSTAFWDYPATLDYVVDVWINVTEYPLIVDTGSSNLAVALESCSCGPGSSDLDVEVVDECVHVQYGSGEWSGYETVPSMIGFVEGEGDALIVETTFAGIETEKAFFTGSGYNGILGLGYPALAAEYSECNGASKELAIPLVDTMYQEGLLNSNTFALTFCSGTARFALGGDYSSSSEDASISFVDVQKTYGEVYGYYLVSLESVLVDGTPVSVESANAIGGVLVDSGTTLLYFPETTTKDLAKLIPVEEESFFTMESCLESLDGLPQITLGLRGYDLVLQPSQYTLHYDGCYYYGIGSSDVTIIGNIALQNRMVVFDRDDNTVGFADVQCPSSPPPGKGQSPPSGQATSSLAAATTTMTSLSSVGTKKFSTTVASLALFSLVVVGVFVVQKKRRSSSSFAYQQIPAHEFI